MPGTLAVLRIAWRRWVWASVALEIGMGCLVGRLSAARQRFWAWLNAGFAIGFAVTWVVVGRVRQRRGVA